MLKVYIKFDNVVVDMPNDSFVMEIPDPRIDWTETDDMLKDQLEEWRRKIWDFYTELIDDCSCIVLYEFELGSYKKRS